MPLDSAMMLVNVTDGATAKVLELVVNCASGFGRTDVGAKATAALKGGNMAAVAELVASQHDALLAAKGVEDSNVEAAFALAFGSLAASQPDAVTPLVLKLASSLAGTSAKDDDAAAVAAGPPARAVALVADEEDEDAAPALPKGPLAPGFKPALRLKLLASLHNLLVDRAERGSPEQLAAAQAAARAAASSGEGAGGDGFAAHAAAAAAAAPTEAPPAAAARRSARLEVLVSLMRFAGATGRAASLAGTTAEDTAGAADAWGLTVAERRRLHLVVARLHDASADELGAQREIVRFLATFDNAADKGLAAHKGLATRAALGAVRAPVSGSAVGVGLGVGALDGGAGALARAAPLAPDALLRLPAVAQLKGTPEHELLSIVSHETLEKYFAFKKKNKPEFFSSRRLDLAACDDKMRMLSLCSLAATRHELPYDDVAAALQIDVADVEPWVVRATSARLLDARIDQLRRLVIVSRAVHRAFGGADEWKALQVKLGAWKGNVRAMIDALAKARAASGDGSAAPLE